MEYQIVETSTAGQMQIDVALLLAKGWFLVGGLQVTVFSDNDNFAPSQHFYQAMAAHPPFGIVSCS